MKGIEHGCESGVISLDVVLTIPVDSRGLSEPDGANFWMGKDDRRNVGVVNLLGQMRATGRVL